MTSNILKNLLRFLLLLAAQVWVVNNIRLHGLFHPQIYPLFLLLLPLEIPTLLLLLLGFASGLMVDFFSHSGAIHASAMLVVAALRPQVLAILRPAGGYQPENQPTISSMGFLWFTTYAFILLLAHHVWLFIIETFSIRQILFVAGKIILSTLASVSIAVVLQYLFYRKDRPAIT